jgi:hypothetical protein
MVIEIGRQFFIIFCTVIFNEMCLAVLKLVYSNRGVSLIGTSYRSAHVRKGIAIYTGIGNRFFPNLSSEKCATS